MKLTVKNFGPIRAAKSIEVKPMTIFVGPSNTGKSYLAMLIYATNRALSGEDFTSNVFFHHGQNHKQTGAFFRDFGKSQSHDRDELKRFLKGMMQTLSGVWRNEVMRCFGENAGNLIKAEGFECILSGSMPGLSIDLVDPDSPKNKVPQRLIADLHEYLQKDIKEMDLGSFQYGYDILGAIWPQFLDMLYGQNKHPVSHYLPAIRGGIIQSHRALAGAAIGRAAMTGGMLLFNGVMADFMQRLLSIDESGRQDSHLNTHRRMAGGAAGRQNLHEIRDISGRIESDILSGRIEHRLSEVGYPDFLYHYKDGVKGLPLMSASSSVSELAPVVLFIRHHLRAGELFIVEEPEAHLHPAAQRDIARLLVQLANAGVQVLITTHSDVILEQIAICVHASEVPDDILQRVVKDNTPKIAAAECSAYLFRAGAGSKNPAVQAVKFDEEAGFTTRDHLSVASDLYNETSLLLEAKDNMPKQDDDRNKD